ncbi:hypothetical protein VNO78_14234 [Psophocarpus tetragonolobus]|uniref:Integral membrane bound transporter domain-containing protein n=1 Tax=Psophocarpus tetragonolobus TaxID=3891 RepID=A0AAN9SST3_PSOTE
MKKVGECVSWALRKGCVSMYGAPSICTFPAFSYVTAILAVCATIQSIGPAMFNLGLLASILSSASCFLPVEIIFKEVNNGFKMNKRYKRLTKNILKRLKLAVKVICKEDKTTAVGLMCEANSLVTKRTKLLSDIMRCQEGMQWETLPIKMFRSHWLSLIEKLEEIDTNLRGTELALTCTNSFPVNNIFDQDLVRGLNSLEEHVSLTIKQAKQTLRGGSLTIPESNGRSITQFLQSLHVIPTTHQQLSIFFFLFYAKLLHKKSFTQPPTCAEHENNPKSKEKWVVTLRNTNLKPAVKPSLSLALAVLLGLVYSKENGFWAGLAVAVGYVSGREATFRGANVKVRGTVLGSVYGVLVCFVFERFIPIRFMALLPWFIITSFLQRSGMYGTAGGISAVIGAVLILGTKALGHQVSLL